MTLVAGFRCRDGLILCADTQEVIAGYTKLDTDKISTVMAVAGCVSVAGAGDADLIDMVIDRLTDHFVLDGCPVTDWRGMEKEIRNVVVPLLRDQMQQTSFLKPDERPWADLLIASRAQDGKTMLKISGTKARRVTKAQCVGAGLLVADSLVKRLFDFNMPMKQAGLLAIYILHQAKQYVDGVGGNTELLFIGDWGLARIPTADVQKIESWWDETERIGIDCAHWLTSKPQDTHPKLVKEALKKRKAELAFYDSIYAEIDAVLNPTNRPKEGMVTKIIRIGGRTFTQSESV